MNDPELRDLLSSVPVPAPTPEARALAKAAAAKALGALESRPREVLAPRIGAWVGIVGSVAALIVVALTINWLLEGDSHGPTGTSPKEISRWDQRVSMERKVFEEIHDLFPERLQSVVHGPEGTEIRVGSEKVRPGSPCILIQICSAGGHCVYVASFSGQELNVKVGARTLQFRLLLTGDDQVILSGDRFVWADGAGTGLGDIEIRAQSLSDSETDA